MPTYTFRCNGRCTFYTSIDAPSPASAIAFLLEDERVVWQPDREEDETPIKTELAEFFEAHDDDESYDTLRFDDYKEEGAKLAMKRAVDAMKALSKSVDFKSIKRTYPFAIDSDELREKMNKVLRRDHALDAHHDIAEAAHQEIVRPLISPAMGDRDGSQLTYVQLQGREPGEPLLNITADPSTTEEPINREGLTYVEWLRAAGIIEAGEKLRPINGPYSITATLDAWNSGEDPTEWRNDDRVRL